MLVGHARASTQDQKLELQQDASKEAKCERIFGYETGGTKATQSGLMEALAFMRPDDSLIIWKLPQPQRGY